MCVKGVHGQERFTVSQKSEVDFRNYEVVMLFDVANATITFPHGECPRSLALELDS